MTPPKKDPPQKFVAAKAGRRQVDQMPPPCLIVGETLNIGKEIRRWLQLLTVLTVLVALVVGGVGVWTFVQNRQNTTALCSIRDDAQRRVDLNRDFLKTNPQGIPGIPPAQIELQIRNSIQTVDSLSKVGCPPLTPLETDTP